MSKTLGTLPSRESSDGEKVAESTFFVFSFQNRLESNSVVVVNVVVVNVVNVVLSVAVVVIIVDCR